MAAAPHERQRDADRDAGRDPRRGHPGVRGARVLGARVDVIATKTRTTKRMLYYYFESKAGLYTAVLERAYAGIRESEQELDVEELDPVAAIRRLAELTFDHHESHPDFIRLVMIENIHRAEHLTDSMANLNMPAIEIIGRILERGRAEGVFRRAVRRRRRAHDDQRLLRLPGGQPAHVRHDVRPRPDGPRAARALPSDARRHGRGLLARQRGLKQRR